MKLNRYISGLLLLCFSAFLGHNLVPHHHHTEVFPNPMATDCPFEHGDREGHDHDADDKEHPVHCHAFNDVVFEKNSISFRNPDAGCMPAMEISRCAFLPEVPPLLTTRPFHRFKLPFRSHIDTGTRALRAPPAAA